MADASIWKYKNQLAEIFCVWTYVFGDGESKCGVNKLRLILLQNCVLIDF